MIPCPQVLQAVLERGDKNGDGQLCFPEFATLVAVAIAIERQPSKADRTFGRREARSVNEVASQAESFPFGLISNGNRITRLVDECDPDVRETAHVHELHEREELVRQHERGVRRRASQARRSIVSAFGDGSSPQPVRRKSVFVGDGAGDRRESGLADQRRSSARFSGALPPIGSHKRNGPSPDKVNMRQRSQAMDRLGEVGEVEARRKRILGPVFLP